MTTVASPRDRLLGTASRLFYAEGIHTVGVDRLVAEAGVTRATFYRHFPAKEDLVVAYLQGRHEEIRAGAEAAITGRKAADALVTVLDFVGESTCALDFRGCPFINAAAEYPDPAHPVRQVVSRHRAWFWDTLHLLVVEAGHPDPDHVTGVLVLLRDGALQGGELDDPTFVRTTLQRAIRDLF
jgi:AcrR family transcriptional regulator